jgi:Ca2+-binding RTX toxin-like protein
VFHRETTAGLTVGVDAQGGVVFDGAVAARGAGFEYTEIDGGPGDDMLNASPSRVPVVIDAQGGNDTLLGGSAGDYLYGGDGDNFMMGGAGDDGLYGGSGNDVFAPGGGTDSIDDQGGSFDSLDLSLSLIGGTIDLSKEAGETQLVNATQTLSINGRIEDLIGTEGNDIITGNSASNFIEGLDGSDVVRGGAGDDIIEVADGSDSVDGQDGSDSYFVLFGYANNYSIDESPRTPAGSTINDSGATGTDAVDYDCNADVTDTGRQISAGGATVSYSGVELHRCGAFSYAADWTYAGYRPAFTPKPFPTSKDQCNNNGWQAFGVFRNNGDCVSYVATSGRNSSK